VADDKLNLVVEISAHTQGLDGLARQASLAQDAIESLSRAGEIGEEVLKAYSSAGEKVSASLGDVGASATRQLSAFEELQANVRSTTSALQELAQANVVAGGRNPLQDLTGSGVIDVDEAREILAIREAERVSAEQVARAVIDAEEQKVQKVRESNDAIDQLQTARRNEELAELKAAITQRAAEEDKAFAKSKALGEAEEQLSKARRQRELAEMRAFYKERAKLEESTRNNSVAAPEVLGGRDYGNFSVLYDAGIKARQDEAEAWSKVLQARMRDEVAAERQAAANDRVTEAVQEQSESLPTLRYALYDVSSTLMISGAAMTAFAGASFAAAISYERSFADVIRTNDQLRTSTYLSNQAFEDFVDLAGEIPTSFQDLSQIGTLAGQLGVPAGRIRDFVESVAMFSATTGESIDLTATAFGRLDALLPDVQGNYQALGSSILKVGVNSVATEGEIVKISTQLAGVSRQAGLTTDELVGLAGALASVGVQPELARGTITRLFGQISRAVSEGGDALQGFAAISGTSSQEFASSWNSAPMEATLGILRGLRDRGSEAESALRGVGITSVRDVPAILRLSQTVDSILVPALKNAESGFLEATELSENYGVIAETTASRLQILVNNLQSLMAAAGDSTGVFKAVIDGLNGFVTLLRDISNTPVLGTIVQLGVVLTAVGGVLLVIIGLATRFTASVLAMRTAMKEMGITATGLTGQMSALTVAITGADAASLKASKGIGLLTTASKALGWASVALIAVGVADWIARTSKEAAGGVVDIDTLTKSLSNLALASGDTRISDDIAATVDKALTSIGAAGKVVGAGDIIWESIFAPAGMVNAIRRAFAQGDATVQEGLDRLTTNTRNFWNTNFGSDEYSWWAGFFDPAIEEIAGFEQAWISAWTNASTAIEQQAILDYLNEFKAGLSPEQLDAFNANMANFNELTAGGVDASALLAEQSQATADAMEQLKAETMGLLDALFEVENASIAAEDSIFRLGESMFENGSAFDYYSVAGRENLGALMAVMRAIAEESGGDASTTAANYQALFEFIQREAPDAAAALNLIRNGISSLGVGRVASSGRDFSSFFGGWEKGAQRASSATRGASQAAREAAKEVRTLKDYASDLAKVWSRAFEIRFSGSQTLDAITSSFISIREASEEAAKKIRDLKNDIASLQSDISIQEYFLSIAIEYGDTKRAEAIEADLAKKRAELADKTADLQKEQDAANKSLVGNSKGAIANRKQVEALVQQYQAHIGALAASGMSQADLAVATQRLKADFIAQATQLGYNQQELQKYASAFDDVSVAIANIPPVNIDISGLGPAQIALREMQAAINAVTNNGRGYSIPISTQVDTGSAARAARLADLQRQLANAQMNMNSAIKSGADNTATRWMNEVARLSGIINSGGYAQGGYTGAGGKYEPAGIVHRGEYVIPKQHVNQATGLPYADALGRLMNGVPGMASGGRTTGSGQQAGVTTVALTAGTIQAIAQATGKIVMLDGQVIANSSSNQYATQTMVGAN
jgi:TP901 family phage tail tape measure protein